MVRLFALLSIGFLLFQAPSVEAVEFFQDKARLREAALRYGDGSPDAEADAKTYGDVIGDWCFDQSLTSMRIFQDGT